MWVLIVMMSLVMIVMLNVGVIVMMPLVMIVMLGVGVLVMMPLVMIVSGCHHGYDGTKEQSRQHQKHFPASPLGQYYAGSSLLNFGCRKRIGVFRRIWPSATICKSMKGIIMIFLLAGRQ